MSIKTGITQETPSRIQFGAGVYFSGVAYNEKVPPTETEMLAGIMGATQDGGKLTITPEIFAPELDGALVAVKELQTTVGETAVMETTMVEVNANDIAKRVIGTVTASTDGDYDVITSSSLKSGHFYEGFGYYGELLDGRPFIVVFKNALCTSGLPLESKNKENGKFAATFECQSDLTYGVTNLPYAIFIHKAEGW
ncbi:MAG: hypothetical protein J6U74_03585, partial [Clostridia bacterium]|nr:hypothetical protein [Clostridia bacterium]